MQKAAAILRNYFTTPMDKRSIENAERAIYIALGHLEKDIANGKRSEASRA